MKLFSRRSVRLSVGLVVFVIALVTYSTCVQPTVPFWDCGEFTAAAVYQQVPHPPGAPLFLMLGKIAHLVPIGDPAMRVNMLSVIFSAITIWLLFEVIVLCAGTLAPSSVTGDVIQEAGTEESTLSMSSFSTLAGAAIGSLAFCFSDTFWFNAVESEVYATSTFFVAVIVMLILRWNLEAESSGSVRYLVMIAYVVGLSLGVHLLSVLTVFSVMLIVAVRVYGSSAKTILTIGALGVIIFFGIYPGIVTWMPTLLAGNLPFLNEAREYIVRDSNLLRFIGLVLVVAPFVMTFYGVRNKRRGLALAFAMWSLLLLGFTTYTQILLRAKASPPMNENAPTSLSSLVPYVSREQYGDSPLFPRRFDSSPEAVAALKKYGSYTPPPMKSVNSEQFPGTSVNVPDYSKAKMNSGDWSYLFRYQLDHMFLRYLMWNFFGRVSDVQDADAWNFTTSSKSIEVSNFLSGSAHMFPVVFWGLPFILGLFGAWKHGRGNPWQATAFLVMFFMMGVATAFIQNQQEPQPRERDYFYTGAFLVFALWIGLGARAMIMALLERINTWSVGVVVAVLIFIAVPGSMAFQGWRFHSRAGNYLAFDYSYNILQSCEQNAILFTNGDNDTFPLWLLQDVYGIRRDIRVVNLSLAGGLWYINQLKSTEPWGALKIPLTFTDEQLTSEERSPKALQARVSDARRISIPLSDRVRISFGLPDSVRTMEWVSRGYDQGNGMFLFTRSQQVVEECVINTRGERPVYFAVTCGYPGSELYCGLGDFCRQEGMVYRVCPAKVNEPGETIDETVMEKSLLQPCSPQEVCETPKYGFVLRNLANDAVYYDEIQRRYVDNYRTLYIRSAQHHLRRGNTAKAKQYLDAMSTWISDDMFPMPYALLNSVADFYAQAGDAAAAHRYDERVLAQCRLLMDKPHVQSRVAMFISDSPPALIAALACTRLSRYDEALRYVDIAAETLKGPGIEFQRLMIQVARAESRRQYAEAIEMLRNYLRITSTVVDAITVQTRAQAQARLLELEKKFS